MRRWLLLLLLFVLCFNIFAAHAQDDNTIPSNDPPYPCPHTNGAYYQPNLFPRYDIGSKSLVLVDMTTGETVRVLDTLSERNIRLINWSPDCRYLSGAVGTIDTQYSATGGKLRGHDIINWLDYSVILWDAENGGRVQAFDTPGRFLYNGLSPVIWSPDGDYSLILGGCNRVSSVTSSCVSVARIPGDFLWKRNANTVIQVENYDNQSATQSFGHFNQYYWDFARQWVWGSTSSGVIIYSLNDGAEVAYLQNCCFPEARFVFSPDITKVAVYSVAYPEMGSEAATITVYDIATMTGTEVNVEGLAAPYIPFADYHPVALSPDNRYLVVGYDALRVWDLQNLPENVDDRLPVYRHGGPKARIWSVRFAAPEVIETTSEEGTQRWDLHTGAYIP